MKTAQFILMVVLVCTLKAQTESADTSAERIIENYIEALGGRDNLEEIKDRTTVLSGSVQEIYLAMKIYQHEPDLLRQEIDVGGTKQVILYNGEKGIVITNGEAIDITGAELEKLSREARLNLILRLDEEGIETAYLGIDTIDSRPAAKISMKFLTGIKWVQFYDDSSGLKIKEIKPVATEEKVFEQEIFYSDYREVENVKYPFLIRQQLGSQSIELKVDTVELNTRLSRGLFDLPEE